MAKAVMQPAFYADLTLTGEDIVMTAGRFAICKKKTPCCDIDLFVVARWVHFFTDPDKLFEQKLRDGTERTATLLIPLFQFEGKEVAENVLMHLVRFDAIEFSDGHPMEDNLFWDEQEEFMQTTVRLFKNDSLKAGMIANARAHWQRRKQPA